LGALVRYFEKIKFLCKGFRKEEGRFRETRLIIRSLIKNPLTLASIIVLGALVFMAIFAPWIAPHSIYEYNIEKSMSSQALNIHSEEII
jgi:ABC-type dipeptide/oligopeptide/nickel transport system permease subunit